MGSARFLKTIRGRYLSSATTATGSRPPGARREGQRLGTGGGTVVIKVFSKPEGGGGISLKLINRILRGTPTIAVGLTRE